MRVALYALGVCLIVASVQASLAAAYVKSVPEIDGGTLVSGLGLLSGGIMVLRARFARK
jgi:hypothetical protein